MPQRKQVKVIDAIYSCPLGRRVLEYKSLFFFLFFSPSRMCKLIGFSGIFFFVASKFNSEKQAMFCGRILASKHSMIILVTKPISITPLGKQVKKSSRSKRSLKAKANHSLKIFFRINHHTGA